MDRACNTIGKVHNTLLAGHFERKRFLGKLSYRWQINVEKGLE
jgi:hypothetical protein